MKLRDAKPGQHVVLIDRMPNGEVRRTFYERLPNAPCRYDYNVPVARLRTTQGFDGKPPRYDSKPMRCTDPGEALGGIIVSPA